MRSDPRRASKSLLLPVCLLLVLLAAPALAQGTPSQIVITGADASSATNPLAR